ncbi:MAG: hypothetical protein VSS75_027480 [Candidatus Parabeggiatoa sp.]|nr:hypothetical protein [Candidatus Parabeggiatoa sp.]
MNKIALPILLLLALLSGCGGGSDSTEASSSDDSVVEDTHDSDEDNAEHDDETSSSTTPLPTGATSQVKVLAFNDLGMHCMDKNFSVFSILPPFNVVNAQVVSHKSDGSPQLLTDVDLRYSAVMDRQDSINSSSLNNKTDFWQYAPALFGTDLQPGEGLTGLYMPADNPHNPGPQPLSYNTQHGWFSAEGIPITPIDDTGRTNAYPMLRISAYDKQTGDLLGETDIVVPVSQETECNLCHGSGEMAANDPTIAWATDGDLNVQSSLNILILHDIRHDTQLQQQTPVLCASCHYSPPLDLAGKGPQGKQQELPTFSQVMHEYHGELQTPQGTPVFPANAPTEETCYQCHPGKTTQCQRGAMKSANIACENCHGGMLAVGGEYPLQVNGSLDGQNDGGTRRPWIDLPRCQSCHTGDAVNHLTGDDLVLDQDNIRLRQTYRTGDESASPLLANNRRFAENQNTLFRNSKGHGGIACEGCHGSPHAIWPNPDTQANDNLTATQLQGHIGSIIECHTCHTPGSLPMTINGPHGLHNINDARWIDHAHEDFYERNPNGCKACHGNNLEGTPLSKAVVNRTLQVEGRTVTLKQGQQISCDLCHHKP